MKVTDEEEALTRFAMQRDVLGQQVPIALAEIYQYCSPCRVTSLAHDTAQNLRDGSTKIGRNTPSPCGSGKKQTLLLCDCISSQKHIAI